MCGIAGVVHFDKNKPVQLDLLKKMTDCLSHRGPDGEGQYIFHNIGLGHRRLSIIDLETGNQPMHDTTNSISIVFNGEIYNYIELREELMTLGYRFKTNSDTEVIIQSYIHWGTDCQNKFNGMWAFALYDKRKDELFLSRDRVGEKPLFYCTTKDSFFFASEMKSFFAYGVPKINDTTFTELYLSLGFIPAPHTAFKNIYKLEPGKFLILKNNNISINTYWDIPQIPDVSMNKNTNAIINTLQTLLYDAVKVRLRSDVDFGAFLSGGMDSSIVVGIMSELLQKRVNTFTIGYNEQFFDERFWAKQTAKMYNCIYNEKIIEPNISREIIQHNLYHYDEPFGDSSAIPTRFVSEFASQKVKMVLTGDGGDELFAGYTAYQGEKIANAYGQLPKPIRKLTPECITLLSYPFKGNIRYKLNRIKNALHTANLSFADRRINKMWAEKEVVKTITANMQCFPIEDYLNDFFKKCTYTDSFNQYMYFNIKLTLPNDILVKVDRMSMAHSLETRIPLLDYRIIELMTQVHKQVKMPQLQRKAILKKAFQHKVPNAILHSRKRGFTVPVREWFKSSEYSDILSKLYTHNWNLNNQTIKEVIQNNESGTKDYGNFIWMLMLMREWYE